MFQVELNSNMALAAIVAGEKSVCSSICNFRSLPDRRVHFIQNKDCSLLSLVQDFAGFVFVSVMSLVNIWKLLHWNCINMSIVG